MCLIWKTKIRKETLNIGICITGKITLPKETSIGLIKKNIKDPEKKLLHLFRLYSNEYRVYEQLLGGLVDMLGALHYHYNNHSRFEIKLINYYKPLFDITFSDPEHRDPEHSAKCANAINSQPSINLDNLYKKASYEASAYLNRLGQIKTLLDSDWFREHLDIEEIKKRIIVLERLIHLRNKVTAHRREDDPRKEDIGELSSGMNHFRFRASIGGDIGKKAIALHYQLISKVADKGFVDFVPQADHFLVIQEILYCVEHSLFNLKNKTFQAQVQVMNRSPMNMFQGESNVDILAPK